MKNILKLVTPPTFIHWAKRLLDRGSSDNYGLSGDYDSWDEAVADATGYDSEIILEKTKTALLKVKNGAAVYERDSVLFDQVQYSWPLLAGLMWVAAQKTNLNVLDFGGSLGSSYFQNRAFLLGLPEVRWNIIEQPKHVDVGKKYFEDGHLKFYPSIKTCLERTQPNIVVLGGILQYLERPYDQLRELSELACDYMIIDRTSFWDGPRDRLCVQKVPPDIYAASYPSWIFSKKRFYENLPKGWDIVTTFNCPDKLPGPVEFTYQGAIIARKSKIS